jgi:hypothetical protein
MPRLEIDNTAATARPSESRDTAISDNAALSTESNRTALSARNNIAELRGMDPEASLSWQKLAQSSAFVRENSETFQKLWTVARVDPRADRGAEILAFAKLFEPGGKLEHRTDLLAKVSEIASSNSLFGKSRAEVGDQEFNKLRREFLVDVIRNATNSDNIIQGREPLCTAASAVKMLSAEQYLGIATELALKGEATTASGAKMKLWDSFYDRAHKSSSQLDGAIFCAQPSAGSLILLYGVMQLGDAVANPHLPLVERQDGAYWHQYVRAAEKLVGTKFAAASAASGQILYDLKTGVAVREATEGAVALSTTEYIQKQLTAGKKVFIHSRFSARAADGAVGGGHAVHAMVADGLHVDQKGETWVRCSNPIGDFFKRDRGAGGKPESYRVGATLGDPNGYWFKVGENGDILVRKDVFEKQLYVAMVTYDEKYTFSQGDKVEQIGGLSLDEGRLHNFMWVDYEPEEIHEPEKKSTTRHIQDVLSFLERKVENTQTTEAASEVNDRRVGRAVESRMVRRKETGLEDGLEIAQAELDVALKKERSAAAEREQGARDSVWSPNRASVTGQALQFGVDGGVAAVKPQGGFNLTEPSSPVAASISNPGAGEVTREKPGAIPAADSVATAKSDTPQRQGSSLISKTLFG